MATYGELERAVRTRLTAAGVETAAFEARALVGACFGLDTAALLARRGDAAGSASALEAMTERRCGGEPLQYILGEWDFYGRTFRVGPGVLIPRADTETLARLAVERLRGGADALRRDIPAPDNAPAARVWDLCAGSGCLAVTVAAEVPDAEVTAVELSERALPWLEANVARLAPGVRIVRADVLEPERLGALGRAELIVSNPPYIPTDDLAGLQREVRAEPAMALDGGADGLRFYRSIAASARRLLTPGGALFFEIGIGQERSVPAILTANGFERADVVPDEAGRPRVARGYVPA